MRAESCPVHGNRGAQPVLGDGPERQIHAVDFAPSRLPPELRQRFGMISNRRTKIVVAARLSLEIEDLRQDPAVLEEIICSRWILGCVRQRALSRQPRYTGRRINEG